MIPFWDTLIQYIYYFVKTNTISRVEEQLIFRLDAPIEVSGGRQCFCLQNHNYIVLGNFNPVEIILYGKRLKELGNLNGIL